jgi:hypothetical protein
MHDNDEWTLYFAIALALVIRMLSSPFEGLRQSIVLVFTSLGCTIIFTAPTAEIIGVQDQISVVSALAALITITAMGLVKWLIAFVDNLPTDPRAIIQLVKQWRNGK